MWGQRHCGPAARADVAEPGPSSTHLGIYYDIAPVVIDDLKRDRLIALHGVSLTEQRAGGEAQREGQGEENRNRRSETHPTPRTGSIPPRRQSSTRLALDAGAAGFSNDSGYFRGAASDLAAQRRWHRPISSARLVYPGVARNPRTSRRSRERRSRSSR